MAATSIVGIGVAWLALELWRHQQRADEVRAELYAEKEQLVRAEVERALRTVAELRSRLQGTEDRKLSQPFGPSSFDEAVIQAQALRRLERQPSRHTNYLFGSRFDGHVVLGPGAGKNMLREGSPEVRAVIRQLIAKARGGGGFVEYTVPAGLGQDPVPKLSYVHPIEGWNWYLGAGTSLASIESVVAARQHELTEELLLQIAVALAFFATLLGGAYLYARHLARKTGRAVGTFANFMSEAAASDTALKVEDLAGFEEFRQIGVAASSMLAARIQREEDLRKLLYDSPMATAIVQHDGAIRSLNRRFVSLFGYEPEEIPDLDRWHELAFPDPEYRENVRAEWERRTTEARSSGADVESLVGRVQAADGSERFVEAKVTVLERHSIVQFHDRTALVQKEHQLKETEARLWQSRKLEAIGQLAGGVAHDFNNLLMPIIASAELLGDELPDDERQQSVARITRAADRAAALVRQLLTFSRTGGFEREPIEVHAVIDEALQLLAPGLPAGIQSGTDLRAERCTVIGDASQLTSALLNLGLNARDAMPEGGSILYRSETRIITAKDGRDSSRGLPAGEYLALQVVDDGNGIEPEHYDRLFEPFFTTKEVGKGTGLGLSAAYGTIQDMGGALWAESEPGLGAIFHILLPLTGSTEENRGDAPLLAAAPRG